jgi:hypothetical protein
MTYASQVMTLAHQMYRAQGRGPSAVWRACLTEAHAIVKRRMQRDAWNESLRKLRMARAAGIERIAA